MSTERKYTVAEIDALRSAMTNRYIWGSAKGCGPEGGASRGYDSRNLHAYVEDAVRTHMQAGHTAADILAEDSK